jgi:hypothetical protein
VIPDHTRPTVGGLTVPYMVDAERKPIDFKEVDAGHVRQCAKQHRCGICGGRIKSGPYAFIGPDDGRRCFADPWMHLKCARLAMAQCPFLGARRGWRDAESRTNQLLAPYAHNMRLFAAPGGRSHMDQFKHWHFEADGGLWKPSVAS